MAVAMVPLPLPTSSPLSLRLPLRPSPPLHLSRSRPSSLITSPTASASHSPNVAPLSSPHTETEANAIVVGGGPAGCLMTHYLLQRGFHVHIFERYPPVPTIFSMDNSAGGVLYKAGDSRSYPLVITSRAVKALAGVGLQLPPSLLKPLVGSCSHMPNGQKVYIEYLHDPNAQSFSVSRNALVSFLQQSLLQRNHPNLSAHFGWELSEISSDKTKAYFNPSKRNLQEFENENTVEGETLEIMFDLLIGADGISSKVRSELLRLDKIYHQSKYEAVKAAPMTLEFIKHPLSYKSFYVSPSLAKQSPLFKDQDRVQSWSALGMLLVNVSDGSFWGGSQNPEVVNAESPREVERLFRDNAPDVLDMLMKENPYFPEEFVKQPSISFGGAVKLSRFHDDNIVLIGDAAHAMFPSYGTGCNAALEDCLLFNNILAGLTSDGEGKYPVSRATVEFTKQRLEDAHTIVEMNSNFMLFNKGRLGFLQANFFKTLQNWFPYLFGPTAYQLLWSDVPFSKIKLKKKLENAFFYATLVLFGSGLILVSALLLRRIFM